MLSYSYSCQILFCAFKLYLYNANFHLKFSLHHPKLGVADNIISENTAIEVVSKREKRISDEISFNLIVKYKE